MKNTILKKTISLLAVFAVLFCAIVAPANVKKASAAEATTLSTYHSWDFTSRSEPEPIRLTKTCDSISVYATCEDDEDYESGDITCYIEDLERNNTNGVYSKVYTFDADGSVTTIFWSFPPGVYKVYFVSNLNIKDAVVIFSKAS